jgi:hypothetical protein|tara:strand:- start:1901 stop:2413 length:513 start_codon:yes stop_codon:yes gene_type:complete
VWVRKQLIAVALTIPFVLSACSSESESSPSVTPMVTESASPAPSENVGDSCAILDQMQASLSTAVADLVTNPDLVTAFETEFDNQVVLLTDLVSSLQGESAEQQQLRMDLDAALLAKDEALNKFNDAQEAENSFSQALGMADAALSARDAVKSAQRVLDALGNQLMCDQP